MLKALRSVIHSFTYSFTHSFIHSFVRSFVSFFFCFESFVRQFIYSFVRSFVCLLSNCIIHSLFHLWCCHNISSFFIKRPKKYHQCPQKKMSCWVFPKEKPPLYSNGVYTLTHEINRFCRRQNIKKLTPAEQQIKDVSPQWISAVCMIEIQIQTVH